MADRNRELVPDKRGKNKNKTNKPKQKHVKRAKPRHNIFKNKEGRKERNAELRSCVKVEVAVLGSPSLINLRFLWT